MAPPVPGPTRSREAGRGLSLTQHPFQIWSELGDVPRPTDFSLIFRKAGASFRPSLWATALLPFQSAMSQPQFIKLPLGFLSAGRREKPDSAYFSTPPSTGSRKT